MRKGTAGNESRAITGLRLSSSLISVHRLSGGHEGSSSRCETLLSIGVLKHNVVALAQAAKTLKLPIVVTTTSRDSMWGPTFPELVEALPGVEITELLNRHPIYIDLADAEAYAGLYAPDRAYESSFVSATGRSDIAKMFHSLGASGFTANKRLHRS